jgi:hypothetical protein
MSNDILRELAACKASDPYRTKAWIPHMRGKWMTVNVPAELWERIQAAAAAGVTGTQAPDLTWMVPAMREMAKGLPNNKADALLKWASAIERASGVRVCDTAAYCASVRRCTRADSDRSLKCAVVPGVGVDAKGDDRG